MKAFKKLENSNSETSKMQDNVDNCFKQILSKEILDGVQLTGIELKAGQVNKLEHKLQRRLLGYFVRLKGNSIVWDVQDANKLPELTLNLMCTADVFIDLWVY